MKNKISHQNITRQSKTDVPKNWDFNKLINTAEQLESLSLNYGEFVENGLQILEKNLENIKILSNKIDSLNQAFINFVANQKHNIQSTQPPATYPSVDQVRKEINSQVDMASATTKTDGELLDLLIQEPCNIPSEVLTIKGNLGRRTIELNKYLEGDTWRTANKWLRQQNFRWQTPTEVNPFRGWVEC